MAAARPADPDPDPLDERVALAAARLVIPVPRSEPEAVAGLRAAVDRELDAADAAARRWTGLGADLPPADVRIVSRLGWVRANLEGMRGAFVPVTARLRGRPLAAGALGAQLGTVLGLLSTRVLGQYVVPLGRAGAGQLVLVGPNLMELSSRYGNLAADVRRAVLLHELAHRLQFDGVPWLGDHLRALLLRYLEAADLDAGVLLDVLGRLPEAIRAVRSEGSAAPLLQAVLNPEQREIVAEAQALMTLLEGHGNATMHFAAEGVVSDPGAVAAALERRRTDAVSRVLVAVAGLEMKRRQYTDGEAFVRAVVARAGTDGLNAVFESPEALPDADEIADPDAWLARTHRPVGDDRAV